MMNQHCSIVLHQIVKGFFYLVQNVCQGFTATFFATFNSSPSTSQILETYWLPKWQRSVRYRRVASGFGDPPQRTLIA
jgi:hypothetical protein